MPFYTVHFICTLHAKPSLNATLASILLIFIIIVSCSHSENPTFFNLKQLKLNYTIHNLHINNTIVLFSKI